MRGPVSELRAFVNAALIEKVDRDHHDPDGAYVRRCVPELSHLPGAAAHEPGVSVDGYAHGYPERIVDHAAERREALDRYQKARSA